MSRDAVTRPSLHETFGANVPRSTQNTMTDSDLKSRLLTHSQTFTQLLSLIPAKYYFSPENPDEQWHKRKQTKAEMIRAKKARLGPEMAFRSAADPNLILESYHDEDEDEDEDEDSDDGEEVRPRSNEKRQMKRERTGGQEDEKKDRKKKKAWKREKMNKEKDEKMGKGHEDEKIHRERDGKKKDRKSGSKPRRSRNARKTHRQQR